MNLVTADHKVPRGFAHAASTLSAESERISRRNEERAREKERERRAGKIGKGKEKGSDRGERDGEEGKDRQRSRGTRGAKSEDAGKKGRARRRNRFFPVGPGRGVEPRDRSLPPRITYMQRRRRRWRRAGTASDAVLVAVFSTRSRLPQVRDKKGDRRHKYAGGRPPTLEFIAGQEWNRAKRGETRARTRER